MNQFGKTLEDQIDEIDGLLFDALERLGQARYALDTLRERLAAATDEEGQKDRAPAR